mmetsp:Transcript_5554/g.14677  ORF Transcript_5554/g.14677 Transcript_5554/m.14677 type:complete len:116 (+) Transcript_5554:346-693(+)
MQRRALLLVATVHFGARLNETFCDAYTTGECRHMKRSSPVLSTCGEGRSVPEEDIDQSMVTEEDSHVQRRRLLIVKAIDVNPVVEQSQHLIDVALRDSFEQLLLALVLRGRVAKH